MLAHPIRTALVAVVAFVTTLAAQDPFGAGVRPHPDGFGLAVTAITPGSVAERAGLRVGDLVFEGQRADGEPIDLSDEGNVAAFDRLVRDARFALIVFRGDDRANDLRIEVDRSRAAPPGVTPPRPPGGSWITRALRDHGTAAGGAATTPANRRTVVLHRQELRDPGMNNMVSHTLLVPDGWRFDGGVRWTSNPTFYVHFVGSLQLPDGVSANFDFNRSYAYNSNPQVLAQMGVQMGQTLPDGTMMAAPPQRAGQAAAEVLLPLIRPGATNVRVVSSANVPEAEQPLRELMAPLIQQMEQSNQFARSSGLGTESRTWIAVERTRLAYTENGREWEEELLYSMMGTHMSVRMDFMNMDSGNWSTFDVRTARAPRGRLDAELPQLVTLVRSVQPTPRWSIALQELQRKITEIQIRGQQQRMEMMRQTREKIAQTNREISDMQMDSWRRQQESQDRVHRAVTNTIRGVEDWKSSDGTSIAVDNSWSRVFQDGTGNLLMTNDPLYDPRSDSTLNTQSWSPLQQIDPFGR